MTVVKEILKTKGNAAWSVTPRSTVGDALRLMAEKNVGAVLVAEEQKVLGIFSERDFARISVRRELPIDNVPVAEVMTTRVLYVTPETSIEACMSVMTNKRVRHLPVVENGELVGLVSIGDVVNKIIEAQKFSIDQLEKYISGNLY